MTHGISRGLRFALLGIMCIAVMPFVIVYVVIPVGLLLIAVGAVWGGGHGVVNYGKALMANIKPERPWVQ